MRLSDFVPSPWIIDHTIASGDAFVGLVDFSDKLATLEIALAVSENRT
jgi:hypothetical protein